MTTPGDTILGWTPSDRPPSDVPVLRDELPFIVFDDERQRALRELAVASDDEARLEALLIIDSLYQRQVAINSELAGRVADLPQDTETERFWSWTQAWMAAAKVEWRA